MITFPLLTSERTVKDLTGISANLAGEYVTTAIREAQDIELRGVLGDRLVDKLVTESQQQNPGPVYMQLLNLYVQKFLAYATVARLIPMVGYKVANMGLVKTTDENVQGSGHDELALGVQAYRNTRDAYARKMQGFCLDHRADLPELDGNTANEMRSNLHSSANPGLWLGGRRGKKL